MRSSAVSPLRQLLTLRYCSNSLSSLLSFFSSVLVVMLPLLSVHCPLVDAVVDIGQMKHCFERYDGHRIVAASPFLSEWRRGSEEQCLEFCVRSASRCGAIVYDKGGHICHYFTSSDLANLVRRRKFVYLRVTDRNCTDSLKIKLVKETASKMHKNGDGIGKNSDSDGTILMGAIADKRPKVPSLEKRKKYAIGASTKAQTITTMDIASDSAAVLTVPIANEDYDQLSTFNNKQSTEHNRNSSSSVPSIAQLLAELDAELARQSQEMALPPPPPQASLNGIEDEAMLLAQIAKKGRMLSEKEIRRSPRINERSSSSSDRNKWHQNAKIAAEKAMAPREAIEKEQNEMVPESGEQQQTLIKEGKNSEQYMMSGAKNINDFTLQNPCDNSELSHRIWLAVENTRLANANRVKMPQKAANTPRECVRVCTNLMVGPRPCNAFAFSEREKRCLFGHSGNDFPSLGTLETIRDGDFSQRTFRQFCYPASLSPFENCAEFLAFTDYRLEMEPREIFDGLPATAEGLSACIELCVLSSDFRCMSASFDYVHGICRLFHSHSLSNPDAFREHQDQNQLYFENGCVESAGEISEEISQMGSVQRMRQK